MHALTQRMLAAGALTAAVLTLTGCASVPAWDRAALSDYTMQRDRDPLRDALTEHIYFSREAVSGGRDIGGGGCGCN